MLPLQCDGAARRRFEIAATALAALTFLAANEARASFTENIGTDPKAMSLGNAVTADPPGIDSIHFNPAGLSRLQGKWKSDTFFGASIKPYASFTQPPGFDIGGWTEDPTAGTSTGPVRQSIFLPGIGVPKARLPFAAAAGLGFSFNKPGSDWTFGTAAYVVQGVGIDRTKDPVDPARFDGQRVNIQRLVYASPSVAFKVSKTLSVG